jgi:hypothetical protein
MNLFGEGEETIRTFRLANHVFYAVISNIIVHYRLDKLPMIDGHLLLYTLSHIEPSGNAPVRPGYNELTLQLATAACHVQRPNRNYYLT